MKEETFKKCWTYWSGLFPVSTRKQAAYFKALKWIPEEAFQPIIESMVSRVDTFPSVKQIRECYQQLQGEKGTAVPGDKQHEKPLPDWTVGELEAREAKLVHLISSNSASNPSSFDVNVKRVFETSLERVRHELTRRRQAEGQELSLDDVPLPDEPEGTFEGEDEAL